MESKTTTQQNKMLHALFKDIAKALNEEGISMQEFIKDSFEMMPDEHSIKYLFKQLANKAYGVDSTQKLNSNQIDKLLHMFQLKLGGYGIELDLPENNMQENKELEGCPCGNDCCTYLKRDYKNVKYSTFTPSHDCDDDFCEDCHITGCPYCNATCGCEV